MNLQTTYNRQIIAGRISPDPAQQRLIYLLEDYSNKMHSYCQASLFDRISRRGEHPGNLYIYGRVGRGKTMLMDMLYNNAKVTKKRYHFGSFMRWLHQQLSISKNIKDPLAVIAKKTAQDVQLMCFDEFQVLDIGDAMLLATLLYNLLEQRTMFCITSNLPPSELYKDGLQRSRFIPAIKLIEKLFQIISLDSEQDYRRLHVENTQSYLHPINESNNKIFFRNFNSFVDDNSEKYISVNSREVATLGFGSDAVCFDFTSLCREPRSTTDYIEICERFLIVFLTNLERLTDDDSDSVRRFINLIDQLYDNKIMLVCLSQVAIDEIYTDSLLSQPFERCQSRIIEMQSTAYQDTCLKKTPRSYSHSLDF